MVDCQVKDRTPPQTNPESHGFLNTALSGNMSLDLLLSYSKIIVATSYSQLVIDQKVCKKSHEPRVWSMK